MYDPLRADLLHHHRSQLGLSVGADLVHLDAAGDRQVLHFDLFLELLGFLLQALRLLLAMELGLLELLHVRVLHHGALDLTTLVFVLTELAAGFFQDHFHQFVVVCGKRREKRRRRETAWSATAFYTHPIPQRRLFRITDWW
jgi:hypothetical protein